MQPQISAAACVQPVAMADAAVSASPAKRQRPHQPALAYSVNVSSVGTAAVNAVTVTLTIPPAVTPQAITSNMVSCSMGPGIATCDLGTLAAGSTRRIDVVLLGSQAGTFASSISLAANNDAFAQNNATSVSLTITQPSGVSPPAGGGGGGEVPR